MPSRLKPAWVHKRPNGQTALSSNYQLIYNPNEQTATTWKNEIARLAGAKKERMRVL
jgi:hypothetical protein